VSGANKLSLKELAILLQRLPVPMGVGDAGGADELGELMTQLLVCQPSPFRTMTLLLTMAAFCQASQEVPVVEGNVGFREVGVWMVKQLAVVAQVQEQAQEQAQEPAAESSEDQEEEEEEEEPEVGAAEADAEEEEALGDLGGSFVKESPSQPPVGVRGPSPRPTPSPSPSKRARAPRSGAPA